MAAEVLSPAQRELFQFVDEEVQTADVKREAIFEAVGKVLGTKPMGSVFELLCFLRQQGQITNDNVNLITDYIADVRFVGEEISEEIKKKAEEYKKELPAEQLSVTGREGTIETVTRKLETVEDHAVVNLFGESGVGKTTVAREICRKWKDDSVGRSVLVDLREVKAMEYVYRGILLELQQDKITLEFEEEAVFGRVRALTEEDKAVLVLLDNSDWFASAQNGEQRKLRENFLSFLERLKSVEVDKFQKVRILLTSRFPFADAKLVEDIHLEPLEDEQSGEILKSARDMILPEEEKPTVLKLCGGRPLLLNTFAAAGKQENMKSKLKTLINKIGGLISEKKTEIEKSSGAEETESRAPEHGETTEPGTAVDSRASLVLRSIFFSLLSKSLQNAAVSLSLFCHPFPSGDAAEVLEVPVDEACLLLEALRSYGLIIIPEPEAKEQTYDIHPLLKEVLKGIGREPEFIQVFQAAEARFSHKFMDLASRLGKNLDRQYIEMQRKFNLQRANFELSFDVSRRRDDFFIREYKYHSIAVTAALCDAMLDVRTRMKLFQSWAESAEKNGQDCLAADLRCWQALSVLVVEGSHKAYEVLKKAEASLDKATSSPIEEGGKGSEMFQLTEAKYHFARGIVYQGLHNEPNQALDEYFKSLKVYSDSFPGDHTETARCLNEIGNCYQGLNEPSKALKYYRRAYDMRERLSDGEDHLDMPVYRSQIGAVHHHQGNYDNAIQNFQNAIDLEEKLKISGSKNTAVYYRNIANAYLFKDEYKKALEPATKAYEIRNEIFGVHPETTWSLYQIGLIWDYQKKYDKALSYFKEAWEMEKSLAKGHHSAVRDEIVEDIRKLYNRFSLVRRRQKIAEKRDFEEDALQFYRRIWKEENSLDGSQFSPPNRAILNKIIDLCESLGEPKEDIQIVQKEALELYEKTWKERDILPETKWDKTQSLKKNVQSRKEVLKKIIELSKAVGDEEKTTKYREEARDFCKALFEDQADEMDESARANLEQTIKDFAKCLEDKPTQKAVEQMLKREKMLKEAPKGCLPRASAETREPEEVGAVGGTLVTEEGPSAGAEVERTEGMQEKPEGEGPAEPEDTVPAEPEAEVSGEPAATLSAEVEAEMTAEPEAKMPGGAEAEVPGEPEDEVPGELAAALSAEVETDMPVEPDADPFYKVEMVDVPPEGLQCDFIGAAVRMSFPAGAVSEPQCVACSVVNPSRCKPPLTETEALVSCVVRVSPAELCFSEDVTLALSFSATKFFDYEVVIKEMKDTENNAWEDLSTVDKRCEAGHSSHSPGTATPPIVETTIRRTGTFAAICRLASDSFILTAAKLSYKHCRFPNLGIFIPDGAFGGEEPIEVQVKVQEISFSDLKSSEVHVCPAVYLEAPELNVTFKRPVRMSFPLDLRGRPCSVASPSQIRVYFSASGGSDENWEDITDQLDTPPSLEDDLVTFEVDHFSGFLATLRRKGSAFAIKAFRRTPTLPALFRACERWSQKKTLTRNLYLFCFPEGKGCERLSAGDYENVWEASSNEELTRNQKSYLDIEKNKGGVEVKDDIKDFFLMLREGSPFSKSLCVQVNGSESTKFTFYKDPGDKITELCSLNIRMDPPESPRGSPGPRKETAARAPEFSEERYISRQEQGIEWVHAAAEIKFAVGRIKAGLESGTGFRIAKRLMMTCEHLGGQLREGHQIVFNYSERPAPDSPGATLWQEPETFNLRPDVFYHADEQLDYAVMAIEELPGQELGPERSSIIRILNTVRSTKDFLRVTESGNINVMGHPEKRPLQLSFRLSRAVENPTDESVRVRDTLQGASEEIILHTADTAKGSSGSPIFDDEWRLLGLHQGGAVDWARPGNFPNYGTLIKYIVDDMFSSPRPSPFEVRLQCANEKGWDLGIPFEDRAQRR